MKIPVVIYESEYDSVFQLSEKKHFQQLLKLIGSISVKKMVFDNELLPLRWPLEHFKRIVLSKIKVTRISTGTLNFNDDNVNEFNETLAIMKNCSFQLFDFCLDYRFTLKDLELMRKLDIKGTTLLWMKISQIPYYHAETNFPKYYHP